MEEVSEKLRRLAETILDAVGVAGWVGVTVVCADGLMVEGSEADTDPVTDLLVDAVVYPLAEGLMDGVWVGDPVAGDWLLVPLWDARGDPLTDPLVVCVVEPVTDPLTDPLVVCVVEPVTDPLTDPLAV